MGDETNVIEYLAAGDANQDDIDDFLDWCTVMCLQPGGQGSEKRRRFWCYRMWARLMRNRRSPFPKDGKFKFEKVLKVYLRNLTGGDVTDAPDPIGAIAVKSKDFVKYVVRHLDDAY